LPSLILLLILVRALLILLDKLVIEAELVNENLDARLADELDLGRFLSHCGRSLRGAWGAVSFKTEVANGAVVAVDERKFTGKGVGVVIRLGRSGVPRRKTGPSKTGATGPDGSDRKAVIVSTPSPPAIILSSFQLWSDTPTSIPTTMTSSLSFPLPLPGPSPVHIPSPAAHAVPESGLDVSQPYPGVPGVPNTKSTLKPRSLSLSLPLPPARSDRGEPIREGTDQPPDEKEVVVVRFENVDPDLHLFASLLVWLPMITLSALMSPLLSSLSWSMMSLRSWTRPDVTRKSEGDSILNPGRSDKSSGSKGKNDVEFVLDLILACALLVVSIVVSDAGLPLISSGEPGYKLVSRFRLWTWFSVPNSSL
jgi:hypothetical protein